MTTERAGRSDDADDQSDAPAPTVSDWIADAAIPLDSIEPGGDSDALRRFDAAIADATVLGLGESTHGTREFFRTKHRLLRYLVAEHGLRLIALEGNFAEFLTINEYVLHGDGDPRDALEIYWTLDSEAVLATIEWVRDYNEGREPSQKVSFHGIDAGAVAAPARRLERYLSTVDPDAHARHREELEQLSGYRLQCPDDDTLASLRQLVDELRELFERRRLSYVEATDRDQLELAVRQTRALEQAHECFRTKAEGDERAAREHRDRFMAENVAWLLEHEGADRIAVWAHNGHVMDGRRENAGATMGRFLADRFGEAYYALGLEFGHGTVRSESIAEDELRQFTLETPLEGSLPAVLTDVDCSAFVLDVTSAASDSRLGEFLDAQRSVHCIGSRFDPDAVSRQHYQSLVPSSAFDGLLFVEESTPSVPAGTPE